MTRIRCVLTIVLMAVLTASASLSQSKPEHHTGLGKTTIQRHHTYFTINNIFSQYANDLRGAVNLTTEQDAGFEWPKGSDKFVVYADGFIYGGYYRGRNANNVTVARKFVNGATYLSGMTEGSITQYGTGKEPVDAQYQSPSAPAARIYRVRPDINPYGTDSQANLVAKLQSEELSLIQRYRSITAQELYDQYVKDWNEWPADKGAPFKDVNENELYDPQFDIPGIADADQTLWMVCNDMVAGKAQTFAASIANGIEIQRTIWGYNRLGSLGNTLFMRYRLINKSGAPIDTVFIGLWSDPDLGYMGDDYIGFDSSRSLGYCYNGKSTDRDYGYTPPAVGYTLLLGPAISGNPIDSAVSGERYVKGKKNLDLTSFTPSNLYFGGEPPEGNTTANRDQWWNVLNGRTQLGTPWIDPTNSNSTKFVFSGDPVAGTGWLDASSAPPGDRRFCMSIGPVFMQAGDTNEIIVAAIVAQGTDRLSSITALRGVRDDLQFIWIPPFGPPKSVPIPDKRVTLLDGAILLTWGDPRATLQKEKDYSSKGYTFEGYRVYQTRGLSPEDYVVVATFDRIDPVLDNTGIQNYILITEDKIKSKPLINGTPYYFAVSALAYNPKIFPHIVETQVSPIEVIPQAPKLGTRLANSVFDRIPVTKTDTSHALRASVAVTVIDPSTTTTGIYSLTFPAINTISLTRDGTPVMTDFALDSSTSSTGEGASPIVEGLQINVTATFDSSFVPNADVYQFQVTGPTIGDIGLAKTQASQINVYPNPYFGFQSLETGKSYRFVTFTHLPQKAIIRICDLTGRVVQSFLKDSPSQFFQWDLTNQERFLVASGIYIVHIEMPDLGVWKILKLAVIQPMQVLDHL